MVMKDGKDILAASEALLSNLSDSEKIEGARRMAEDFRTGGFTSACISGRIPRSDHHQN